MTTPDLFATPAPPPAPPSPPPAPPAKPYTLRQYRLLRIREAQVEDRLLDTPDSVAAFWRAHVATCPYLDAEKECMVAMHLNTRRHITGWHLIGIGTLDSVLVTPREVFRVAIVQAASAIVIAHNHPSGDPTPSEGDIRVTRTLIRAGQLLYIDVVDHVIIGAERHCSMRDLGFFYA